MIMPLRAQQLVPMLPFSYQSLPAMTGHRLCCQGMHSPALGDGRSLCLAVSASQQNNSIQHHALLHISGQLYQHILIFKNFQNKKYKLEILRNAILCHCSHNHIKVSTLFTVNFFSQQRKLNCSVHNIASILGNYAGYQANRTETMSAAV